MKTNTKKINTRAITILIALAFILFTKFLPTPQGLSTSAMQVVGIFIGVLILWMKISIDWPSMLCILALCFVPELKINTILSGSIGSSTFAFLMFTFMCTYTLSTTPFVRRVSVGFMSSKLAQKGAWQFVILYFASVLLLGSVMSPTVLVVVYIAITEEIFEIIGFKKGDKEANMMMMGMVFVSALSAGMTPIAHVFPIMALENYTTFTGNVISYAQYMAVGIPVAITAFIAMLLIFKLVLKPNFTKLKTLDVSSLKSSVPKMDKKEIYTLSIFLGVIALWVLPSLIKPFAPSLYNYIDSFGSAMPPLLGAVLMAIITVDGTPLLNFKQATEKGIPWASLIMVAGTLALGSAMTNADIGLTSWISAQISPFAITLAPIAIIALFVIWSSVQTNLSSNMVTVTVVCAVALPVALATNGMVNTAVLACLIGIMASFAFATPPAMATIVFAIGSGWTNTKDILKYGLLMMFAGAIIAIFIGYPIGNMVM